jgi:uncharacterized membrane protein
MIFWGIGMIARGSLFQAMLTGVIPTQKRSTAFGLFDTGFGVAWFSGIAIMGLLYVAQASRQISHGRGIIFDDSAACCDSTYFIANREC